jgi:acylphosphatase
MQYLIFLSPGPFYRLPFPTRGPSIFFMDTKSFYATVHGRVQGVAFRHYTRLTANRLSLSGWVRNLPSGAVEILAEGPEKPLEDLAIWIHQGPDFARVDQVRIEWRKPVGQKGPFEVRF